MVTDTKKEKKNNKKTPKPSKPQNPNFFSPADPLHNKLALCDHNLEEFQLQT